MRLHYGTGDLIPSFFLTEHPDWFLSDDLSETGLRKTTQHWSCFYDENHMTAFHPVDYRVAEVHTYTREHARKYALCYLREVVRLLNMQFDCLITYVPVKHKGTINFLTKRLNFVDYGVCTTRNYGGEEVNVHLLKRYNYELE